MNVISIFINEYTQDKIDRTFISLKYLGFPIK